MSKQLDELRLQLALHWAFKQKVWGIDQLFEDKLQKKCKFMKVWKDPFDGEKIPKCYATNKGARREDRMECEIGNCPFYPDRFAQHTEEEE